MIRRAGMRVGRGGLVGGRNKARTKATWIWIGAAVAAGVAGLIYLYRSGWLARAWRTHWVPGLFPSLLVLGLVVVLLLWKLPHWQVARSKGVTNANRFDRENEARKTLAQIVGGVFLLAGLYSSTRTLELSRQNEDLVRQGQITDRFTKAIEQLGAVDAAGKPKLDVRLGGIYALERIARDSDRDHPAVMEVLTAYVRTHAPAPVEIDTEADAVRKSAGPKKSPIGADIYAILTVIGRREAKYDKGLIDLSRISLAGADLRELNLRGADLIDADFSGADLRGAHLSGAYLEGAHLNFADLLDADLRGSYLIDAHLTLANLHGADLRGAFLSGAYLSLADLRGADLRGAKLISANLIGVNLNDANLSGADLRGAHLTGITQLTQEQLNSALGDFLTQLPKDLKMPSSWSK